MTELDCPPKPPKRGREHIGTTHSPQNRGKTWTGVHGRDGLSTETDETWTSETEMMVLVNLPTGKFTRTTPNKRNRTQNQSSSEEDNPKSSLELPITKSI